MSRPLLFLDIDGVLLPPLDGSNTFKPEPLSILAAMTARNNVDIVISSTRRLAWRLTWFQKHVSPAVVGVTPEADCREMFPRSVEILLARKKLGVNRPYVAIDDQVDLFRPGSTHLIEICAGELLNRAHVNQAEKLWRK